MLTKSAAPDQIRAAASTLLVDGSYRAAATRLGDAIRERDGAEVATTLMEDFAVG